MNDHDISMLNERLEDLNFTMEKLLQVMFIKESLELGVLTTEDAMKSMAMISNLMKTHAENKLDILQRRINRYEMERSMKENNKAFWY